MFGYTVIEIYANGQYEMSRRFKDRKFAIALARYINQHDKTRGRRALIVH